MLILQQVNKLVKDAVATFTGTCQFCVLQMSEMLESGELSKIN